MPRTRFGAQSLALSLSVALTLSLAACGGRTGDDGATTGDGDAGGGDVPSSLTVAGGSQGSANYNIAAAVGTLLNAHSPMRTTVIPFTGSKQQLPAVNGNNPQIGVNDAGTVIQAYDGEQQFDRPHENLRVLSSGSPNQIAIAVRADSSIESAADIRGKRVTAQFSALPVCQLHGSAQLANLGLTWDDVQQVPVTNSVEAAEALASGRLDVLLCAAPGVAALRELHAQIPLRFLSVESSEEALEAARGFYAYSGTATLPEGAFGYLPNETTFLVYPWSLYAHESLSDAAAEAVVRAIWEHNDEFREIHPILQGWTPEVMVARQGDIPYHDGAVAFYQEVGAWPEDADGGIPPA